MIGAGRKIAAVYYRRTSRLPVKKFTENGEEFRLAILAEPLQFVFIAARTEPGEFRDARIKPAERVGKFQGMQRFNFVAIAKSEHAGL